ncbi:MAG TPA: nucleotide-binding protein, partial [Syntrophobacteraceae bacterium]|nr:nucleotide-binding protein [Syntrophobacteraceae bacterium]
MHNSKYIVGIDLGTTHTVLAFTPVPTGDDQEIAIGVFPVPQVTNPGELKAQPLLPSFLFFPGSHDVPPGSLGLPWDPRRDFAVGEFARQRGAELPQRLVSSAKSWLCHRGVDRTQPILPWDGPAEGRRISPVDAAALLLGHLRDAWNQTMAVDDPAARLEAQDIVLTVPASFDAVARELTVQAAREAGLEHLTLLEEPQAAVYAWLEARPTQWRKEIQVGDSVLVCDVGGGTTDFSLIQAGEEEGSLVLRRVAVGDHILLGGDNMDLTLAYAIQGKLAQRGVKLDAWQMRGLWHSCRQAKERLLADPNLTAEPVVVLGRGSSVIGGTIRTELTREDVVRVLLDGFFPECDRSHYPEEKPRVGMREMGLPYAVDPAVTHHLARFLGRQHAAGQDSGESRSNGNFPSMVLFNGGVMKSELLRQRVLGVLNHWRGDTTRQPMRELTAVDPDLAVARGAAYYGLARRGQGIRIRGGVARSFYVGIETSMPSVPGIPAPIKAFCVVPFGLEEGSELAIREKEFGLVVGEPAEFSLLASTVRKHDQPGEV